MNDLDWPEVARFCVEMMMKYLYRNTHRTYMAPVGQGSTKGGQREEPEQWRGNRKGRQAALTPELRSSPPGFKESRNWRLKFP